MEALSFELKWREGKGKYFSTERRTDKLLALVVEFADSDNDVE